MVGLNRLEGLERSAVPAKTTIVPGVTHAEMPIEIACGNCGNSFGVEAGWAGLIVQCPFCQTAVQVPDEVAAFADEPNEGTPPDAPPEKVVRRTAEHGKKSAKKEPRPDRFTKRSNRQSLKNDPITEPDLADTKPVPLLDPIPPTTTTAKPAPEVLLPSVLTSAAAVASTPVVAEPASADTLAASNPAPTQSVSLAIPEWTVPPECPWLEANAADEIRVSVRAGLTTINYHGQKMVLRDQPEAANWYGRLTFAMSVVILALLLTWLYYVYR